MNASEDQEFTEFLRSKAAEAKALLGFRATDFLGMLGRDGGFATAKRLLSAANISKGFTDLVMLGRADFTVEALVTETRWRAYFDPMLLEHAERRLRDVKYPYKRFKEAAAISAPAPATPDDAMTERELLNASDDALAATDWLKTKYGAKFERESRKEGLKQGDHPTRLYTLPDGSQVAIRMNVGRPAIYIRARSVDGFDIKDAIAAITQIRDIYPKSDGGPPDIISRAPYLKPGPDNELLKLNPQPGQYIRIFEIALGPIRKPNSSEGGAATNAPRNSRPTSEEEFLRSQERNSETGRAGEHWVLDWEYSRLANMNPPCPDPQRYVTHIALSDVGAGYDIVSTWPPGEERYIEVKTTAARSSECFMTENERQTLEALGTHAWLYRVELDPIATTIITFQDPVSIFEGRMSPSAWRVKLL
ncbi:MAG: DUF3883 domain-containing protein [Achromobacter sp.]|uniref:DUF3883 domain-containing protein n=1 Tax=Achromobacter sp. TaxID=134375 RepID=UPI0012CFCB09|nr:DUF3883 domain-containing protein [Achromobacter sp.]MPS82265.1 DUF3883 domain-containing protein [Achromobacter sp.]